MHGKVTRPTQFLHTRAQILRNMETNNQVVHAPLAQALGCYWTVNLVLADQHIDPAEAWKGSIAADNPV